MLRAGIIGLGVGEKHIEAYMRHPQCEVIALCDFNEEKLKRIKEKYSQCKVTQEADDILTDPDIQIVSIASFDNYHYEQIITGLQNNKHIFVEKPLCLYNHEARGIRKCLNENPYLKMSSNLILRKSPRFRRLKELIEQGELGKVFYLEGDYNYGRIWKILEGWRGTIDFYSAVYGGGVHIVDLFLWLTEELVEEVFAYGNRIATHNSEFKYNDFVVALLRFKNGMNAKLAVNLGCVYPHFHKFSVYGTEATFENDLNEGRLFKKPDPSREFIPIQSSCAEIHKGDLLYNFVDSIVQGVEPEVGIDDILNTMSVCFAIEQSSYQATPVQVEYI